MRGTQSSLATALLTPEINVLWFGFLLNYPWEFIQAPLFEGMAAQPHWQGVKICTQAAIGDAVILLMAYWGVALAHRHRGWITVFRWRTTGLFLLIGLSVTICIEALAVRGWWLESWNYAVSMPVIPGLRVGLLPVLQWVMLPPVVVAMVGRQIRGGLR